MDVKVTCRMDPVLDEDVILAVGEMIEMNFMLNLNGQWTNGQETCNGECENLNVSLAKGGREVAVREYDSLSDGENQVVCLPRKYSILILSRTYSSLCLGYILPVSYTHLTLPTIYSV